MLMLIELLVEWYRCSAICSCLRRVSGHSSALSNDIGMVLSTYLARPNDGQAVRLVTG